MVRTTRLISLFTCVLAWASPARAGQAPQPQPAPTDAAEPGRVPLTYAQAVERARAHGPTLAVAEARVAEARAQVEAAEVYPTNPQVMVSAGPRLGGEQTRAQVGVRATQWLETGGQRGHRVDAAEARVEASAARREDAARLLTREVGLAFVEGLYWQRRVEIAVDKLALAQAAEGVARRRHEVGDVGGLEESSAALASAHAALELERDRARLGRVEGQLSALLGYAAGTRLELVGDLRELAVEGTAIDGNPGAAALETRPDLRALEAEGRRAQAMEALGQSERAPKVALGLGYTLEESEHVVLGVVGIALPVFERGQGEVAVARAEAAQVDAALEATRSAAAVAADTGEAFVRRATDAALQFERDGLAQLERTAELTTVGYDKGAVAYDAVLVVRLELVAARLDYTDLLHAAAAARVELAATKGVQP